MHLSNDKPIMKVSKLPLSTFLPTPDDCDALRRNYAVLLGREVVRSVSYFKKFNQYVPDHITHEHTTAMNSKSVVVSSTQYIHYTACMCSYDMYVHTFITVDMICADSCGCSSLL